MEFNDYQLDRSEEAQGAIPPPPGSNRSRRYTVWAIAVVAALGGGAGIWFVTSRRPAAAPTQDHVPSAPAVVAAERPTGPLVAAADIDLPPLSQTDALVRELVARLSAHPTVAAWLVTKGLIANFTVVTLNIAEGRTATQFLRPVAPKARFQTRGPATRLLVDPRSYDRYAPHAAAVASLDNVGTASLYLTLKPRITDAYRELGYPEGDFDRVLERAVGRLLQTPRLDGDVALVPTGGNLFGFSDPKLEALSPAQKQLLRLGPTNGQVVHRKLEEIAALLGLHPQ